MDINKLYFNELLSEIRNVGDGSEIADLQNKIISGNNNIDKLFKEFSNFKTYYFNNLNMLEDKIVSSEIFIEKANLYLEHIKSMCGSSILSGVDSIKLGLINQKYETEKFNLNECFKEILNSSFSYDSIDIIDTFFNNINLNNIPTESDQVNTYDQLQEKINELSALLN